MSENTPSSNPSSSVSSSGGTTAGRLDEQLCFALYAATNAVTRVYRPLLKRVGLTYPQYLVMLILWEYRSRQIGEIADSLHLASHAVTPVVDRLEQSGLVRRIRDGDDRRVVHVVLTDAGADLEERIPDIQDELRCRTTLDRDDVARLQADLVELAARMNARRD